MNFVDVITLSSDDEEEESCGGGSGQKIFAEEPLDVKDFDLGCTLPAGAGALEPSPGFAVPNSWTGLEHVKLEAEEKPRLTCGEDSLLECPQPLDSALPLNSPRMCRNFWKSGDYHAAPNPESTVQNGRNRLRINPRFLHSNATSHKWAFGALAELLDNAIDEVHRGATFVKVDKFVNPRDGSPALIVQDDGGGMTPESLRCCMSFGFSDKQSQAFIGQYGNGFKTSTMRLGADAIVFTRSRKEGKCTQSLGLLSYTFLRGTGADDILVPSVDYAFDPITNLFGRLYRHDQKHFNSNLSTILKWSPFLTEAELVKQFDDIGDHGTKVIIFNLWYNDDGKMELDFNADVKDIMIRGTYKQLKSSDVSSQYVANRIRHSLRAYASILYLHLPQDFTIYLRGHSVQPHNIANDLEFPECVLYRPQVGAIVEASVVTTIGFLKDAPNVDVQGFNVYHKNRLILPFWRVASNSYGKGRGVVGVLEANFIKPTHDKQDFEKSTLFQKLEIRLKEMTYEYWDLHCHLVGYDNKKLPRLAGASLNSSGKRKSFAAGPSLQSVDEDESSHNLVKGMLDHLKSPSEYGGKQVKYSSNGSEKCFNSQPQRAPKKLRLTEVRAVLAENRKLKQECLKLEELEDQLVRKESDLRLELENARNEYRHLLDKLETLETLEAKAENP